jgi:hypothetical protein
MRVLAVCLALVASPLLAQPAFDLRGYVAGRGVNATGPRSWLEGGFGRLEAGGDRDDFSVASQMGIDWRPSKYFDLHVSGAARRDPEEFGGDDVGVVEAYVDARALFGLDELQLRAGLFFLPTSRENKDELWASPYAISFSALNTWIGQEVRPLGLDLEYRHTSGGGHIVTGAFTAFRGNDTMGTLLGWRGWTIGNRLSVWNEVLPLPPLESLQTHFERQRDDGTKPFGRDLDGKNGYAARVRWSVPQRANIQYTWLDNGGDRLLYGGEYSWATDFHLLGGEIGDPEKLILAAEYMTGSTGMGVFDVFVQTDFYAAYALLSHKRRRNSWTVRFELFGTEEKDFSIADSNDESGRSWTLAWLFDVTPKIRAGVELTQVDAERAATPDLNGRTVTAEVRYKF